MIYKGCIDFLKKILKILLCFHPPEIFLRLIHRNSNLNMTDHSQHTNPQEDVYMRYLNDELSREELEKLDALLQKDDKQRELFNSYRNTWLVSRIKEQDNSSPDEAFKRFQSRIISDRNNRIYLKRKNLINSVLKVAAILVIAFLTTVSVLYFGNIKITKTSNQWITETIVPMGSKTKMILPDGTEVWLNADSKLTYNNQFNTSNREVFLEGEGYFKVTRSEKKKFIVHAQELEIKALGTEFNVKAYPDENQIETMLVEGKVVIDSKSPKINKTVSLLPAQRLIYQKKSKQMVLVSEPTSSDNQTETGLTQIAPRIKKIEVQFDPRSITSWKEEDWVIDRERLVDLAIKIERKYNVDIQFEDKSLKNFKFTGTLKNESLEQVLKVMSLASPMIYDINGKNVKFREDKKKKEKYRELYELTN